MIARIWHGWTTLAQADAYEQLLCTEILPGIAKRGIDGFRGIELWRQTVGEEVEFVTVMRFTDRAAVVAFAGEDHEVAVVPPAARALLSRFDQRSRHYDIRLTASPSSPLRTPDTPAPRVP